MLADHSTLINPRSGEHILLLYDDDYKRNEAIATYINEGLKRNQLCVIASANTDGKTNANLSSLIIDYEENIKRENLLNVDLRPFYNSVVNNDLTLFEDIKTKLVDKVKDRKDKHIRFVGDLVSLLFNAERFTECINLEQWWQKRPFEGSRVCTYQTLMFIKHPFYLYKSRVFDCHDKAVLC